MSDIFSQKKRSQIMRLVKSSNNKSTELKLIALFKILNIKGWRRHFNLFGKPDFVFPDKRIAIFVDGCFWHGHNCRNTTPKNNTDYWARKITRNKIRDKIVTKALIEKNWKVIRIWECCLNEKKINKIFKQ